MFSLFKFIFYNNTISWLFFSTGSFLIYFFIARQWKRSIRCSLHSSTCNHMRSSSVSWSGPFLRTFPGNSPWPCPLNGLSRSLHRVFHVSSRWHLLWFSHWCIFSAMLIYFAESCIRNFVLAPLVFRGRFLVFSYVFIPGATCTLSLLHRGLRRSLTKYLGLNSATVEEKGLPSYKWG